ncbi:MAG: vanadium-dependent haloperoxidase [Pseudomonadota bacterium]
MTQDRRQAALAYRIEAANAAAAREHPPHEANGDEQRYAAEHYAMSFTKGLAHDFKTGLLDIPEHFVSYRRAIDDAEIDAFTANTPVPVLDTDPTTGEFTDEKRERRKWEAPTAGVVFELEGPDPQAVTMPPAPSLGSPELTLEMAEVYELALLRDVAFSSFADPAAEKKVHDEKLSSFSTALLEDLDFKADAPDPKVKQSLHRLHGMRGKIDKGPFQPGGRPRLKNPAHHLVTAQEAFRGSSPGNEVGPYLSQFMLIGTWDQSTSEDIRDHSTVSPEHTLSACGRIAYGAIQIDQMVLTATEKKDFMQSQKTWFDVQQGFMPTLEQQTYEEDESEGAKPGFAARRFISTPRDLATYVHFDALYEAYLNACLILLAQGAPLDPAFDQLSGGGAFHALSTGFDGVERNAGGFALYGGPHVLTLVTEVATRALKAVRYQKFNNHIRLRPETFAGRLALCDKIAGHLPELGKTLEGVMHLLKKTTDEIKKKNDAEGGDKRAFLPMAFAEGSPMHPAYGAGHATVAGACVTMLKAFFDTDAVFVRPKGKGEPRFKRYEKGDVAVAFVSDYEHDNPHKTGMKLKSVECVKPLTLEGELNKLAANISIGRNMAGVHYYSDYYDSLRMGEEISIGILEEQALGYPTDPFVTSLPTFDGPVRRIGAR